MSKREERIQNLAAGLLIAGRTPADALAQSALFVQLCEARDAAEESEATHDPGEDHHLTDYIAAVRELDSCVELWFIQNDYKHGFTPEKTAERWDEYRAYLRRGKQ